MTPIYLLNSFAQNERPLYLNYLPDILLHREYEFDLLKILLMDFIESRGQNYQNIFVIGDPGTGKTALIDSVGRVLKTYATNLSREIYFLRVNCLASRGDLYQILLNLISSLCPAFPKRGFNPAEIVTFLNNLMIEKKAILILCLDEADILFKKKSHEMLDFLTRSQEGFEKNASSISVICVLNDYENLKILNPSTLARFQGSIIKITHYTRSELRDIIRERARLSLEPGTYNEDVIGYIVACSERYNFDARFAVNLLRQAVVNVEIEGSRRLNKNHIDKALGRTTILGVQTVQQSLKRHEKYSLQAISAGIQQNKGRPITNKEIRKYYEKICYLRGEKPRESSMQWRYLQNLEMLNLIKIEKMRVGCTVKDHITLTNTELKLD